MANCTSCMLSLVNLKLTTIFKTDSAVFTSSVYLSDVILEVSFLYQNFVTKESNTFVGNVANNFLRRKDLLDIKGQYMKESITLAGECGKQFSH